MAFHRALLRYNWSLGADESYWIWLYALTHVHCLLSFSEIELLLIRLILLVSYVLSILYCSICLAFISKVKSWIRYVKLPQLLILTSTFSLFEKIFFWVNFFLSYFDSVFFWSFYQSSHKIWVCYYKSYA
jgi:hypothetical protein